MKKPGTTPKNDAQPPPDPKDDLKALPLAQVEKKLGYSPDGLSGAEAQKRLSQYGPNEIKEKKTNLFLKFLSYFWGPIPWMIEIADARSALAQDRGWGWGHGGMMGEGCGMWGMGILGWFIPILVIVVLFLAAVWLIKQIKK